MRTRLSNRVPYKFTLFSLFCLHRWVKECGGYTVVLLLVTTEEKSVGYTVFLHLNEGRKECGYTVFLHLNEGRKECGVHCFSPS